jgi:hypothetical protein
MDPDSDQSPSPTPITVPLAAGSVAAFDWRHCARRLLVCNPFFLCSAAVLLFGVNRLSIDPNFLGEERANLLFNYGALQFYEFLVVGTAIILARRKIWYDSALLVVVEHGLLLVPFMLLSQSALLNPRLGITLAVGAFAFAALRAFTIHRGYPQFNLPLRALALGAALLVVNAALPMIYPLAVEKDTDDWAQPNLLLWYVVMPILAGGANLLPRPKRYGGLNPERHWLPLFTYTLWLAGTGVHIWCLGYISKIEFQLHYLGPTAMVAAWTMLRRIGDCVLEPGIKWAIALLGLTFVMPFIAFGNSGMFEVLVLVNAAFYGLLFRKRTGAPRTLLRELMLASSALLVLGVPEEFARIMLPNFLRTQAVILAIALTICVSALRWFRVRLGLAAAAAAAAISELFWPGAPVDLYLQTAVVILLAHSLGWKNAGPLASALRAFAGAVWIADAAVWIHRAPLRTDLVLSVVALALLLAWFVMWWITSRRRDWIIAASAGAVALSAPSDWLAHQGSPGLIALAVSLALFAMGFSVAWTRHLWEHSQDAASH